MAVPRLISLNGGQPTITNPVQSSAGAANAGNVPALNASGLIDPSMLNLQRTTFTALTASSGTLSAPNALYTTTADGLYEFFLVIYTVALGTAGTATALVKYQTPTGTTGFTFSTSAISLTTQSASSGVFVAHVASGVALGWYVTFTSATGTPTVSGDILVRRIA